MGAEAVLLCLEHKPALLDLLYRLAAQSDLYRLDASETIRVVSLSLRLRPQ